MKNMRTKISTKQKALFIFLLAMGNAVMALVTFPEESELTGNQNSPVFREDYVNIRLAGKMRAELNPDKPVTLVGNATGKTVTEAFVLKKFESKLGPEAFISQKIETEYLVSLPREQAPNALGQETFSIYPNGIIIAAKKKRRKNYEVTY